jgi:hypothetical protein
MEGGQVEIQEGMKWSEKAMKVGGSFVVLLTPEIREYLGTSKDKDGDIDLILKADKGKHGRFLGIGVEKNEKANGK